MNEGSRQKQNDLTVTGEEAAIQNVSQVLLDEILTAFDAGIRLAAKRSPPSLHQDDELLQAQESRAKVPRANELNQDENTTVAVATAEPSRDDRVRQLEAEVNELKTSKQQDSDRFGRLLGYVFAPALDSNPRDSQAVALKNILQIWDMQLRFGSREIFDQVVPPFHLAALRGDSDVCRYILERAKDLEVRRKCRDHLFLGVDALILAVWKGHEDVVRVLLEYGADANPKLESYQGFRPWEPMLPLYVAIREGHVKVAATLIEYGADVNARIQTSDRGDEAPLICHAAAANPASEEIFKLLIDNHVVVNATAPGRSTALKLALQTRDFNQNIISMLEQAGARSAI